MNFNFDLNCFQLSLKHSYMYAYFAEIHSNLFIEIHYVDLACAITNSNLAQPFSRSNRQRVTWQRARFAIASAKVSKIT